MPSAHDNRTKMSKPNRPEMKQGAREVFREQFYKTEMCRYYRTGCAKGTTCSYAHGEDELRIAPDLVKTSLCQAWVKRSCPLSSEECQFAHGWSEMRATRAFVDYGARQSATTKRRGQPRIPEETSAEAEAAAGTPEAPPARQEESSTVEPPPPQSHERPRPTKPRPGRTAARATAAEAPAANAGEDLVGVAIAMPAWALPPQMGQVFMFRPAMVEMRQPPPAMGAAAAGGPAAAAGGGLGAEGLQRAFGAGLPGRGEAVAQALLQGLGDHAEVDFPEVLRGATGQALANALLQAMPDHYED